MTNRRLNYRFQTHDHGLKYKSIMPVQVQPLPSVIDLRARCSPVEDQGQEGSCSGHAAAACVEFLELMEKSKGPQIYDPKQFIRVSRQFIYFGERAIEGSTNTDAGATTLADACQVLTKIGVCRESLWPYNPDTLFQHPSLAAYADAKNHKVAAYYGLEAGYELKHCLASGFPFMLGFQVFASFMSDQVAHTGVMPLPSPDEQVEGGHAVACVGYNDTEQMFIIRNSWGSDWGLNGYFKMPYAFMDSQYVDDFYTLRLAPTANP